MNPRSIAFGTRALGAVLLACAATAARAAVVVDDPGCGTIRVALRADTQVYPLGHPFLRSGGDSVTVAGLRWTEGREYALDRLRGELRLLQPPAVGETLVVAACWLVHPPPLVVQLVPYRRAAAAETTATDTARATFAYRPATARNPDAPSHGETSLTLTGNKSIAVDFGSQQDAALRQSLDLALSGTLAPGVELTGVLSDRNTPLTEGGSTQGLQSLDRVLLELKAPHASAALGDVPLAWNDGEFGRLERRLQGVRGEWTAGPFSGLAAAATQQGLFRRLEQLGVEGQQGPYQLTDEGGQPVAVVAGSDIVTLDGVRLARGEGADYSIDYERGRVTFTNRRPITGQSRITFEYQVATTAYRRNLAAGGGGVHQGALTVWARGINEGDDRGHPNDFALSAEDRARLALAGDSLSLAVGTGVTPGGGDYDTVRVGRGLAYAFAGPDSGRFSVEFASVGAGRGDYAESTLVGGRAVFRYVGPGSGDHRIGRPLPMPQSHQLVDGGAGFTLGPLAFSAEGAASRFDPNTFSTYDDGDNVGGAGMARLAMDVPLLRGRIGWAVTGRVVEPRFAPFTPLEAPFAEESWGLPVGADFEHQRRGEFGAWFKPRFGGELRAGVGRLATASGFDSRRVTASWIRDALVSTRVLYERADGTQQGARFPAGGRDHARAELGVLGRWFAPRVWGELDQKTSPSDTGRVGSRFREAAGELGTGSVLPWHASATLDLRRDELALAQGFGGGTDSRGYGFTLDSPAGHGLTVGGRFLRRDVMPHDDPLATRTRSDLGSVRIKGERKSGATGLVDVEITSEGESPRVRQLVFVGPGAGAYDALGNFVGTGDYDLVVTVLPGLEKLARAATSAHGTLPFGRSAAWRGSRVEFDFETDVRRRGDLRAADPWISPDAARQDPGLQRASVLQRASADLAPSSAAAALFARVERRVTADRTFENYAQVLDDRNASLRWRTHPAPAFSSELELRAQRQQADEALAGTIGLSRTLGQGGGTLQLIATPNARLRAVGAIEATWYRPEGAVLWTRRIAVGPDLGLALGPRGRLDAGVRRAFTSGPGDIDLLPTSDPLGLVRWQGNARVDFRVHESTTVGGSMTVHDRLGRPMQVTGRFEVRAFF